MPTERARGVTDARAEADREAAAVPAAPRRPSPPTTRPDRALTTDLLLRPAARERSLTAGAGAAEDTPSSAVPADTDAASASPPSAQAAPTAPGPASDTPNANAAAPIRTFLSIANPTCR